VGTRVCNGDTSMQQGHGSAMGTGVCKWGHGHVVGCAIGHGCATATRVCDRDTSVQQGHGCATGTRVCNGDTSV